MVSMAESLKFIASLAGAGGLQHNCNDCPGTQSLPLSHEDVEFPIFRCISLASPLQCFRASLPTHSVLRLLFSLFSLVYLLLVYGPIHGSTAKTVSQTRIKLRTTHSKGLQSSLKQNVQKSDSCPISELFEATRLPVLKLFF